MNQAAKLTPPAQAPQKPPQKVHTYSSLLGDPTLYQYINNYRNSNLYGK